MNYDDGGEPMLENTRGLKWYPQARVWMFLHSISVVMILEPGSWLGHLRPWLTMIEGSATHYDELWWIMMNYDELWWTLIMMNSDDELCFVMLWCQAEVLKCIEATRFYNHILHSSFIQDTRSGYDSRPLPRTWTSGLEWVFPFFRKHTEDMILDTTLGVYSTILEVPGL